MVVGMRCSVNYLVVVDRDSNLEKFFCYEGNPRDFVRAYDMVLDAYPGNRVIFAFGCMEEIREDLSYISGISYAEPESLTDGKISGAAAGSRAI